MHVGQPHGDGLPQTEAPPRAHADERAGDDAHHVVEECISRDLDDHKLLSCLHNAPAIDGREAP